MSFTFQLTDEEKAVIRPFLHAKMREMGPEKYAYWSMDQDGYHDDLQACLSPARFAEGEAECEENGEWPVPSVGDFLSELEVEIFGRVVCE